MGDRRQSKMLASQVAFVCALLLGCSIAADDTGFAEAMWSDSTDEASWQCWPSPSLPAWVNGSWILPTVSQFGYGGRNFTGVLDGFGKLNRFQLSGGEVCFMSRMMKTQFYKDSLAAGTVAPSILFNET